jgi:hypothetical protein
MAQYSEPIPTRISQPLPESSARPAQSASLMMIFHVDDAAKLAAGKIIVSILVGRIRALTRLLLSSPAHFASRLGSELT